MRGIHRIAVVTVAIAGCGGSPAKEDQDAAVRTVGQYLTALANKDFPAACAKLVEDERGSQCPITLNTGLADVPDELLADLAEAEVGLQDVDGATVRVRVRSSGAFTAEAKTSTVSVEEEDGEWRIAKLTDVVDPDPVTTCVASSIGFYEQGETAAFWRKEGRADFVEYSRRLCKLIEQEGADPDSREEVQPLAGRVIRDMVEQDRIKMP